MRRTLAVLLVIPLAFAGCLAAAEGDAADGSAQREGAIGPASGGDAPASAAAPSIGGVVAYERRFTMSDVDGTGWNQVRFRVDEPSNLTLRERGSYKSEGSPTGFQFMLVRESKGKFGGSGGGGGGSFRVFNVDERVAGQDVRVGCCPEGGRGGSGESSGHERILFDAGEIISFVVVTRNVTELDFKFRLDGNGTLTLLGEERGTGNRYAEIPHAAHGNATYLSGPAGQNLVLRAGPVRHVIEASGPGIFNLEAVGRRDAKSFSFSLALPNGTKVEERVGPRDAAFVSGSLVEGGAFVIAFTPGKDGDTWDFPPLKFRFVPIKTETPSLRRDVYRDEPW